MIKIIEYNMGVIIFKEKSYFLEFLHCKCIVLFLKTEYLSLHTKKVFYF